jgi:hypothetical protein
VLKSWLTGKALVGKNAAEAPAEGGDGGVGNGSGSRGEKPTGALFESDAGCEGDRQDAQEMDDLHQEIDNMTNYSTATRSTARIPLASAGKPAVAGKKGASTRCGGI